MGATFLEKNQPRRAGQLPVLVVSLAWKEKRENREAESCLYLAVLG